MMEKLMVKETKLRRKDSDIPAENADATTSVGPFIRYKYKYNEKSGRDEFVSVELSDGTKIDNLESYAKFQVALKEATGTTDLHLSDQILNHAAFGMTSDKHETRLNTLAALLPALKPQNETDAILCSQFIALQQAGFRCLRNANDSNNFFHIEGLLSQACKLFRTANETMQTILKRRSGGRQEIQIVHLHNEGQAIVTQSLSSGGGGKEKFYNEPHGS
jgi:hypothetical protein